MAHDINVIAGDFVAARTNDNGNGPARPGHPYTHTHTKHTAYPGLGGGGGGGGRKGLRHSTGSKTSTSFVVSSYFLLCYFIYYF